MKTWRGPRGPFSIYSHSKSVNRPWGQKVVFELKVWLSELKILLCFIFLNGQRTLGLFVMWGGIGFLSDTWGTGLISTGLV